MPRLIDVWRAIDPDARLVAGDRSASTVILRGVSRTRAAPPHLPPPAAAHLVIVDGAMLVALSPDRLMSEITASGSEPAALLVADPPAKLGTEWPDSEVPILASHRSAASLAAAAGAYLADETAHLERLKAELRLAAAESALADPTPSAASGVVAQRMRRGVAVVADGELVALHARPAGRALAARFAAAFSRLFGTPSARATATRRLRDGLWIHEHRIRPGAAVWLFDDLPMARVDEAAAEALSVTLRALLRRPSRAVRGVGSGRAPTPSPARGTGPAPDDAPLNATLLAVARANGRVAPAARSLGVHRNTVLYRLRIARDQRGIDPRRPEDALRLLLAADREADRSA